MGAFDVIYGVVACPTCGTLFHLANQTKFFLPDFGGHNQRAFTIGAPQLIDFDPTPVATARVWDDEWWRVRAARGGSISLLADLDDMIVCGCETPLAFVFAFSLAAGPAPTSTLVQIRALDARGPDLPAEVDFADADDFAQGASDPRVWGARVAALGARDEAARARLVHEALVARFRAAAEADGGAPVWTWLAGATRCTSCGRVAERSVGTMFTHPYQAQSFFGPAWTGGALRLGDRIAVDISAFDTATDRGAYARLRPPAGRSEIVILEGRARWECPCAAGRVSPCARFRVEPGAVVLTAIEARVLRTAADLDDVDFAYAPWPTNALSPPSGGWTPPPAPVEHADRVQRILLD